MEYCLPKLDRQQAGEYVLGTVCSHKAHFLLSSVLACSKLVSVTGQQQGRWCTPKGVPSKLWVSTVQGRPISKCTSLLGLGYWTKYQSSCNLSKWSFPVSLMLPLWLHFAVKDWGDSSEEATCPTPSTCLLLLYVPILPMLQAKARVTSSHQSGFKWRGLPWARA